MQNPDRYFLKKSGIIFSIAVIVIFSLFPILLGKQFSLFPFVIACIISLISLYKPHLLRKPIIFWLRIGEILSKFNSNLVLIIFFYLILTPFALLRKLIIFNKKRSLKSYYKNQDIKLQRDFRGQY